jgi:hypothetical protein
MTQKINSIKIFLLCPIPDDQKPMNEYINLKKYLVEKSKKSISSSFDNFTNDLKQIFINFFLLIRWKEIEKRLSLPSILYEEGSWYDSQIWEKPFSMIKNDRLISTQTVKPVLKKTILFLNCALGLSSFKLLSLIH